MHVHDSVTNLPQRRSLRLKGYDYTQSGGYFITLVTQGRGCLFADIEEDTLRLKNAGQMVVKWWNELSSKFPVDLDEFVVMPNHLHGIIVIHEVQTGGHSVSSLQRTSLPEMVQWFKTMTTNNYIHGVKGDGWTPFTRRLWQRNYYEHIIRDEDDMNRVRQYIQNNPIQWATDEENPAIRNV